ncbi:MAG: DNA-directed RNA polymerase, partial [Clostridium sp.]|nr:DNA-directed RNA polymerase [Clostridium sp.]
MNVINAPKNDFSDISLAVMPFNILADHYGSQLAATQLQLEHEAHTEGEKRFLKAMERQIKAGEFADNAVAKPLMTTLVPKFVSAWTEWFTTVESKRGGRPVAYTKVQGCSPEVAGFITLKTVLSCLTREEHSHLQFVASAIGRSIEDELRFGRIRDEEAKHFKNHIQDALNKRVGAVYKKAFMQAVEGKMLDANQLTNKWSSWTPEENIHVGVRMLELLIASTGLVELSRPYAGSIAKDAEYVTLTAEYTELLSKRAGALAAISPMHQPCVVPPKPWTSPTGGGYWAAGRKMTVLIRTNTRKGLERYNDVHMPQVYKAVNLAQNTPWKINKKVLAVANEITRWKHCPIEDMPALERGELPIRPDDMDTNEVALKAWKKEAAGVYRKEKARVSRRLSMEFMLQQANKFSQFKAIWFPMNLDWRGRVYAIPMFNPQGNDMTKGLLTMAKGKPIGLDGFYWLKIHGANTAGVDKVPFPERIKFIEDNHENILACATDPLGNTWWA